MRKRVLHMLYLWFMMSLVSAFGFQQSARNKDWPFSPPSRPFLSVKCTGFEKISCCTCCSVYVDVVQARILRERTDGVAACVVGKMPFFLFVHTNSGLDHTQVATIVAWPIPTLLLLARSGSQRCCCEHLLAPA